MLSGDEAYGDEITSGLAADQYEDRARPEPDEPRRLPRAAPLPFPGPWDEGYPDDRTLHLRARHARWLRENAPELMDEEG